MLPREEEPDDPLSAVMSGLLMGLVLGSTCLLTRRMAPEQRLVRTVIRLQRSAPEGITHPVPNGSSACARDQFRQVAGAVPADRVDAEEAAAWAQPNCPSSVPFRSPGQCGRRRSPCSRTGPGAFRRAALHSPCRRSRLEPSPRTATTGRPGSARARPRAAEQQAQGDDMFDDPGVRRETVGHGVRGGPRGRGCRGVGGEAADSSGSRSAVCRSPAGLRRETPARADGLTRPRSAPRSRPSRPAARAG